MKKYEFNLTKSEINKFLAPIRNKKKFLEILMDTLKYMSVYPELKLEIEDEEIEGKIILVIDKMKRLFYFSEEKFFSIVFPFSIKEEEDKLKFSYIGMDEIDNRVTSQVIRILKCDEFNSNCSFDFMGPIYEVDEKSDELFWSFFKELLLIETGYIRYDIDPVNYKKYLARGEEDKHPEHHYDIFYSSSSTFKVGLKEKITKENFIELLNINSECEFMK